MTLRGLHVAVRDLATQETEPCEEEWSAVLLRLAYLTVANTFDALRLLPMSDRDKEVLSLRHQSSVLHRLS